MGAKDSLAQGPLLLIWCSTIKLVLLKGKLNSLSQVVIASLRSSSGAAVCFMAYTNC